MESLFMTSTPALIVVQTWYTAENGQTIAEYIGNDSEAIGNGSQAISRHSSGGVEKPHGKLRLLDMPPEIRTSYVQNASQETLGPTA
jgi:hypothetical protein